MFLARLTDHIHMKIAKETKKNGNTKTKEDQNKPNREDRRENK
jgi:hypothetical protein